MIYLYGLLPHGTQDPEALFIGQPGVTGAVKALELPTAVLVYGDHDGSEILAKRRFLIAHARVLETCLQAGTVLPMRFGMLADGPDAMTQILAAQAESIEAQMTRLKNLVEIGVRINFDRDAALTQQIQRDDALRAEFKRLRDNPNPPHFEKAAFGRRLAEALDRHRTETQSKLAKRVRSIVTDLVLRAPVSDVQVLSADLLLPKDQVDVLGDTLENMVQNIDFGGDSTPQIQLIGPEPPYSFVTLSLSNHEVAA